MPVGNKGGGIGGGKGRESLVNTLGHICESLVLPIGIG